MGSVTDVVKRYAPASYRALCGVSNIYYNLDDLQALADFVQFRLYSTIPGSSNEATTWDIRQNQLLGMLTTLQFIPSAIDYWGDQLSSTSLSGPNESESFFDRREELWKLFDHIAADAKELAAELGVPAFTTKALLPAVSYGDNGRNVLVTSDPEDIGRAYRRKGTMPTIPWSRWA